MPEESAAGSDPDNASDSSSVASTDANGFQAMCHSGVADSTITTRPLSDLRIHPHPETTGSDSAPAQGRELGKSAIVRRLEFSNDSNDLAKYSCHCVRLIRFGKGLCALGTLWRSVPFLRKTTRPLYSTISVTVLSEVTATSAERRLPHTASSNPFP